MDVNGIKESLEHILCQANHGYVDLGCHDENEIKIVIEALMLYKDKYNL